MSMAKIHNLLLQKLINVQAGEFSAIAWSFLYFFCLLSSYYIVRPMRDEMGIAGGVENLQWMFSGTFLVMLAAVPLFGWVSSRYERRRFLPYVYYFFILNLALFFVLFRSDITHAYVARAFFIWASIFNLFVVSVFWSFMADIYSNEQARRLFGIIAAGGTTGALAGPVFTASLSWSVDPVNLLLLSALLLGGAVVCVCGGDAVSAWVYSGLRGVGLSLAQIAYIAVPLALVWAWVAYRLGKRQTAMVAGTQTDEVP